VGEGELMKPLMELVEFLGLEGRVIFHGAKNNDVVLDFYRKSDIFVLPSITGSDGNSEGQGLVLQEAQAMQLPVLATLHNGFPEGVKDGITGYLIPEKNSVQLAEKMEFLINNQTIRRKMGEKGREFVLRKFDNLILGGQLVRIYRNLL